MSHKTGLFAFVLVTLVGVFAAGCGGGACDELETKINECCAKAPEGVTCSVDQNESAEADEDQCQMALDDFTCAF